ncbi:MAG TPA: FlgD immunoglobulin-like domain containing protein [Spirochaetota bacterium]|nr:FlgD immunoglobulin-like domain containing protein [Spirochaetota bacterium]HPN81799.1 FlgD immunoglobulin-like domain containing protein [Spirochaetota bacterium]
MRLVRILVGVFLCIPLAGFTDVHQTPASQYLWNGYGPRVSALGFTGISMLGDPDAGGANPAVLGDLRRLANGLSVTGLGADSPLWSGSLAVPTDIGVLSAHLLYGTSSQTNAALDTAGLALRIAKPITEDLFWGFGLSFLYADYTTGLDRGLWADMGILWRIPHKGRGIGLFDPSVGLVLRGMGIRLSNEGDDRYPPLALGLGFSVTAVDIGLWSLRLQADSMLAIDPLNPVLNFGFENTVFNFLKIRLGYMTGDTRHGMSGLGSMTFGIGLAGKLRLSEKADPTDFDLSWALVNQHFHGKAERMHSFGLTVAWGTYDSQAPDARVKPDWARFSPNYDGRQDEVRFGLSISDNTLVTGWVLDILDQTGKTNRSFRSIDRFELRSLNFEKFVKAIFSSKQQVDIPRHIDWNGQDEAGKMVADGVYAWKLTSWDENRNVSEKRGTVRVDTRIPQVRAVSTNSIFSPNGDGARETYSFGNILIAAESDDVLEVKILAPDGTPVRAWTYSGAFPDVHTWDGKTSAGSEAPEGVYSISFEAYDPAGNRTEDRIAGVRLVRRYETVRIEAAKEAFSPTGDGSNDLLRIRSSVSDSNGLQHWTLVVRDSEQRAVRSIRGTGAVPAELVWDGKSDSGLRQPDGFYTAELGLEYDSGNHPVSRRIPLEVDTTPAKVEIRPEYLEFSPNGDGNRDGLPVALKGSGQTQDAIRLQVLDESGIAVLSRDWTLASLPPVWNWDGNDAGGKPVHEGWYTIRIETRDRVGNSGTSLVENVRLKTGLEKVSLAGSRSAISPGAAGKNGQVIFTPAVSSKDSIERFDVVIKDSDGRTVRTLTNARHVPEIPWDGRDEQGNTLKDGRYTYLLKVKYSYGDAPVSVERTVLIDTRPPVIRVKAGDSIFSPNADSRKDTITIEQEVQGGDDDVYHGEIVDDTGRVLRSHKYVGSVPAQFVWDGKDGNGRDLPEGRYTWRLRGMDAADNTASSTTTPVTLVRRMGSIGLTARPMAFSPNGDGQEDQLGLAIAPSTKEGIEKAELVIWDLARRAVYRQRWTGSLPEIHTWNGLGSDGKPQLDGWYEAEVTVDWESGNQARAVVEKILLDARPPEIGLTVQPRIFTPDGDGEDDVLHINPRMQDVSGVAEWEIVISKHESDGKTAKPFKTFKGKDAPTGVLTWDGKSDDGEDLVEAVQEYDLLLTAKDRMGNTVQRREMVTVGVLVERTPDGLRIRVSSVQFATDRAELTGEGEKALDKVIFILRRILGQPARYGLTANARIEVSGHTDDVGDPGYNMQLSQRRARTVYGYLVGKDVDPRILTWAGYGLTRPYKLLTPGLHPVRINEIRERNRRVEFFIRK